MSGNLATILRSIVAVVVGYLSLSICVMVLLVLALALVPGWQGTVTGGYLATNIMLSIISAAIGGWVCARLAPSRPLLHGNVLGLIALVLGILYVLSPAEDGGHAQPPGWYALMLAMLAWPSVILGTLIFIRTRPGRPRNNGNQSTVS